MPRRKKSTGLSESKFWLYVDSTAFIEPEISLENHKIQQYTSYCLLMLETVTYCFVEPPVLSHVARINLRVCVKLARRIINIRKVSRFLAAIFIIL